MITITESDYNLKNILHESKLSTLLTKNKYHVYGLLQKNNSVILIEYNNEIADATFLQNLNSLGEFLKLNGMEIEVFDDTNILGVSIGLRRDLRSVLDTSKKPVFAAAVLSTILYSLENRINIEQMKQYQISSAPAFKPKA